MPCLDTILNEHHIAESIILSICRESHLVQQDREILWTKGLFQGFEFKFEIALHLLIPQIEHLVRVRLKMVGERTTTLDENGIETEIGLSNLLDNENIEKAFDKDLVFELKALLTEQSGPNLRNEVAHGLINWYGSISYYSVYLWWLALKLVVISSTWFEKPENSKQE